MREFQSAGPSSTLNSARGSTHGSLGSNLHQVERMTIVVMNMITKTVVIMMIVMANIPYALNIRRVTWNQIKSDFHLAM